MSNFVGENLRKLHKNINAIPSELLIQVVLELGPFTDLNMKNNNVIYFILANSKVFASYLTSNFVKF